ncbi:DUF4179 domain-containing protein [Neobacillus niacini]|uniref:DUF4179 domain-containing protein n=1 Tax=Neobacillus niacini TaxID=86668 RepID=UPI00052F5306|nr:DUF4179 domain-containing protein [Neobacillus niacini]KGM45281.1 hypothetical protein NP83_07005 [Neobacillus niacini]MEC1523789.1 DUF4179 domain-containing protein [Neobacillus niacini]
MDNLEKRLAEEKKLIDSIQAPSELDARLRTALHNTPEKTKRYAFSWKTAVIALFLIILMGSQYNAVAFYGKKLLGFDEVINGTLKELNEKGMGQIVEKRTELEDGTELMINGLISDSNQLVVYYTLYNPKGIRTSTSESFRLSRISGFLTNSNAEAGTSLLNDEHTEIKGMMSFEPVSPFAKKLNLYFWQPHQNGQMTEESIEIPYNPNKAMAAEFKQSLKMTFKVDKGTISFHSITASPTMTMIKGTVNVENFDRIDSSFGGIELLANGKPIEIMGSSNTSSLRGRKFDIRYNALPKQLDSLEIVIKEFVGYQKLEEKISLSSITNGPITNEGKELWIKKVSTIPQGVEITIATDGDVMLDGVSIQSQEEVIPIKTTVNQTYTKQEGREVKERTMQFDSTTKPEYLLIEGMHYMKVYNKKIKIVD